MRFQRQRGATLHKPDINILLLVMISILGACLMVLSTKWSCCPWLPFLGILPLLLAIRLFSPFTAMSSAAMWGFSIFAFDNIIPGVEAKIPLEISSATICCVVPAIYAYLSAKLFSKIGFKPFLFALGWIFMELALGPLGISKNFFITNQVDSSLAHIVASVLGCSFIGFFGIFFGAIFFKLVCSIRFRILKISFGFIAGLKYCIFSLENNFYFLPIVFIQSIQPRAPPHAYI